MSHKTRRRRSKKDEPAVGPTAGVPVADGIVSAMVEPSDEASEIRSSGAPEPATTSESEQAPAAPEKSSHEKDSGDENALLLAAGSDAIDPTSMGGLNASEPNSNSTESASSVRPATAVPDSPLPSHGKSTSVTDDGEPAKEEPSTALSSQSGSEPAEKENASPAPDDPGEGTQAKPSDADERRVTDSTLPQKPKPAPLRSSGLPPPSHVAWSRAIIAPPPPSTAKPSIPAPASGVAQSTAVPHASVPPPTRPPPPARPSFRRLTPPPPPLRPSSPSVERPSSLPMERPSVVPAKVLTPVPSRPPIPRPSSSPASSAAAKMATAATDARRTTPPPLARTTSSASITAANVRATPGTVVPSVHAAHPADAEASVTSPPAVLSESATSEATASGKLEHSPDAAASGIVSETNTAETSSKSAEGPKTEDGLLIESQCQGTLEPVNFEFPVQQAVSDTQAESTSPAPAAETTSTEHTSSDVSTPRVLQPEPAFARRISGFLAFPSSKISQNALLLGGAGALVALGIVVVALRVGHANHAPTQARIEPQDQPASNPVAVHAGAPFSQPASTGTVSSIASGAANASAQAQTTGAEDTVRVAIKIRPEGARVFYRGKEVGRTPFTLELLRDERRVFEVGYPGYQPRRLVIDGTEAEISYTLTAR